MVLCSTRYKLSSVPKKAGTCCHLRGCHCDGCHFLRVLIHFSNHAGGAFFLKPVLQQDEEYKAVESNGDDSVAGVDIHRFNLSAYKGRNMVSELHISEMGNSIFLILIQRTLLRLGLTFLFTLLIKMMSSSASALYSLLSRL